MHENYSGYGPSNWRRCNSIWWLLSLAEPIPRMIPAVTNLTMVSPRTLGQWCCNLHCHSIISIQNSFEHHAKLWFPDSKVHGANMGPTWGREDPGGPHVGPWTLLSGFTPKWWKHWFPWKSYNSNIDLISMKIMVDCGGYIDSNWMTTKKWHLNIFFLQINSLIPGRCTCNFIYIHSFQTQFSG